MPGRDGPATTDQSGRELLRLGALVALLGTAFVMLLGASVHSERRRVPASF